MILLGAVKKERVFFYLWWVSCMYVEELTSVKGVFKQIWEIFLFILKTKNEADFVG
jgi:hypothetical protein